MGSLGFPELLLILIITLLVFGGKRLPEMARGLGAGIRDFKRALQDDPEDRKVDGKEL